MAPHTPPKWIRKFLGAFLDPRLLEASLGDLEEKFQLKLKNKKPSWKAKAQYIIEAAGFIRMAGRGKKGNRNSNNIDMLKNHFKIGWRNLIHNKGYSLINIGGLAVGMCVAILIGLWIYDEVTYDRTYENHERIARVLVRGQNSSGPFVQWVTAPPFGDELRSLYGSEFKHVIMSSQTNDGILTFAETKVTKTGYYTEPGIADMLSLKMVKGTRSGLMKKEGILLSASTASALFGDKDPMNEVIKLNDKPDVVVMGVYEDLPANSDFNDMQFVATWELYVSTSPWLRKDDWRQNGFITYVQLADHADMRTAEGKIRNIRQNHTNAEDAVFNFRLILHPMDDWRLYSDIEQGERTGRIRFVKLYATIGLFVLLLATINFMNLATARSQKRAREVGIRKSMGSMRGQLIAQFFSESILVTAFAFITAILLTQLALPFFNEIAEKRISLPWSNLYFWLSSLAFVLFTGLISGSYPALYLSSFQPIKVLKGTFVVGSAAALPRKILVVLQFTVSVVLIIGVIVVFRQIQFGKDRPVGYDQNGLVSVKANSHEIHKHIDVVREELRKSGTVTEIAESLNPVTNIAFVSNGFDWTGNGPDQQSGFPIIWISPEYGKTIGWQFVQGRDFSREFASDTTAIVLNETAAKYMNLTDPIGKTIRWTHFDQVRTLTVIGVIKDMLMESPYYAVRKSIYMIDTSPGNLVNIRIKPGANVNEALIAIEKVFLKYDPATPFEYSFVDEVYDRKFGEERSVAKLAFVFAVLAIFISCLGIFGLASFVAEQRTKEIGIRKVMGASVASLWQMLSKEFVLLVVIACAIAIPVSWYFMNDWLQQYEYRAALSWYIFTMASVGALVITLLTVSYQAIKASVVTPIKSLRAE